MILITCIVILIICILKCKSFFFDVLRLCGRWCKSSRRFDIILLTFSRVRLLLLPGFHDRNWRRRWNSLPWFLWIFVWSAIYPSKPRTMISRHLLSAPDDWWLPRILCVVLIYYILKSRSPPLWYCKHHRSASPQSLPLYTHLLTPLEQSRTTFQVKAPAS